MSKPVRARHPSSPPAAATGVLVTNLGTPDAPTAAAVRRYLAEFLWDPRVVERSRPVWWLLLHGAILRIRPPRSARAYRRVWTEAGSPLLSISRRQAAALQAALETRFPGGVEVALGMRYGRPSIAAGLEKLCRAGVERLLVLPLYPQYSATTSASAFDAVAAAARTVRHLPEIRFLTHYHDDPAYIAALAAALEAAWARSRPARLLFSFHGLPVRHERAGDPYRRECLETARLVAERLALPPDGWAVGFQSRFGREPWLEPYTDELLREWGRAGVDSVDVICPGFAADCLETLDEIAVENRARFLAAGGQTFRYVPALNDAPRHIEALVEIVLRRTLDWRAPGPAERP